MSNSVGVIAQYLSEEQRNDIAKELLSHLDKETSLNTLCEVSNYLSKNFVEKEVIPKLTKFCIESLSAGAKFQVILELIETFDSALVEELLKYVSQSLLSYIDDSIVNFDQEFKALFKSSNKIESDKPTDLDTSRVSSILQFLEQLFMSNDKIEDSNIDFLLCYYLAINEASISQFASKILRWRMKFVVSDSSNKEFIWNLIDLLQDSNDTVKMDNGFILWLRYLIQMGQKALLEDLYYQNLLKGEKYWAYLQNGLTSDSHEQRKFSISIIQLSLNSINSSFENSLMDWDITQSDLYLQSWKRFLTLFEIIGIDTSLNQAQDAAGEMISCLSLSSHIPIPFTLSLLSIGFKLSMETVRKFAMNLIFAIPPQNLKLLKHDGYVFLKSHFLKFAMIASNFVVLRDYDESTKSVYKCEFGDKLVNFIVNCFKELTKEDSLQLANKILELLVENTELFELSKIYISLGLLRGLSSRKLQILTSTQLGMLSKLFEAHSDGDVFNTTLQTINLRFILHTDTEKTNLESTVLTISKFIQLNQLAGLGNGYLIFDANSHLFLDYFAINYEDEDLLQFFEMNLKDLDIDSIVVLLSIISDKRTNSKLLPMILAYGDLDSLLIKMFASGIPFETLFQDFSLRSKCGDLMNRLGNAIPTNGLLYQNGSAFVHSNIFDDLYWDKFDISLLWDSVSNLLESNDEELLRLAISQFQFLSFVIKKSVFNETTEEFLSFDKILQIESILFVNAPINASHGFHKVKDTFYSALFSVSKELIKIVNLTNEKLRILYFIENIADKFDKKSMTSVINLLLSISDKADLTEEDSLRIVTILKVFWDNITLDRLVLSQKNLHVQFIKLLYNEHNLRNSASSEQISDIMLKIGKEIVEQSQSRKSLLPTLSQAIVSYQSNCPEAFENTEWLMEMVTRCYLLLQTNTNIFKGESVIADIFDQYFSVFSTSLYTIVYGPPEISFRAQMAMLVGCIVSSQLSKKIWDFVFENERELHFMVPNNRSDGNEEWKRILILQLLLLSIKCLDKEYLFQTAFDRLLPLLFKEPSPLCRVYLEWITAYLLLIADKEQREQVFNQFDKQLSKQIQTVVTSLERICFLFAQQLPADEASTFLTKFLVENLLPSCSSNRALIRHFSVSLVVSIHPVIEQRKLAVDQGLKDAVLLIHKQALRTENYKSYRSGDALLWDISKDYTLVGICGGVLLRVSDREIDFINHLLFDTLMTQKQRENLRLPIGADEKELFLPFETRTQKSSLDSQLLKLDFDGDASALQTKSGAWSTVMNVDEDDEKVVKRSPLIVVASLVDKVVNLGAICRLCDCLGVGVMTVDDISVLKNPQFKTVAVTADHWMPMEEVKIEDIVEYMRFQKRNGYTMIGLEQTDQSVELDSELQFPEKSLILVGKEREGIPGELLAELDLCIEIKQSGVIRSMNIQTATAIICHSYSIQHSP